ncbi:hypothetical protein DUT91_22875 [Phyllobacterium salinisoli]|uniref:Uncharacterized protein n=1 Tax=Phyllobacterium salinisoli TaxID=1899321 RepID=A0A368JYU2_9HYPH|nr:hypothetical protein DUT91_22875 [Phyllobacterium salinisoli]
MRGRCLRESSFKHIFHIYRYILHISDSNIDFNILEMTANTRKYQMDQTYFLKYADYLHPITGNEQKNKFTILETTLIASG